MSFMLGSFTQGMFSGMDSVTRAFHNIEAYKQMRQQTQVGQMNLDAAKAAKDALDKGTGTASATSGTAAATTQGGDPHQQAIQTALDAAWAKDHPNDTSPNAPTTPVKKIDLNSVQQPNYLQGVTTRHNELEHENPGTDGVENTPAAPTPQQPDAAPTTPAVPTQQPAQPVVPPVATIGAPEHAGSAVGVGGKSGQESALDTFSRWGRDAGEWIHAHGPHQGPQGAGNEDSPAPRYIAGQGPAGSQAPNPVAAAQTGWGAAFRPVPNGQPQQPPGVNMAQQSTPMGQQIMSALPGIQ